MVMILSSNICRIVYSHYNGCEVSRKAVPQSVAAKLLVFCAIIEISKERL